MNILLIQSPMPESVSQKEPYAPLGLAYIAAVLENAGYNVDFLDPGVEGIPVSNLSLIVGHIKEPDVVGIGCSTVTYKNALRLAKFARESWPKTVIVMGGCHVTFTHRQTLLECPEIDVVVRNEGEYTMLELVDHFRDRQNFENISGITYRKGTQIVSTPDRIPEPQLDKLPFPARHLFKENSYFPAIMASRGCTRRCSFCSAGAMNKGYRIRSAGSVLKELRTLDLSKVVTFYDNTFSGNKNAAMQICDEIMDSKLDFQWACELRADGADSQLLSKLYGAGCRYVNFGVESGSIAVLRDIHKAITPSLVTKAVSRAIELGFRVTCSFCIGHPSDNEETMSETLTFIKKLRSLGATTLAAIVTPFPGTEIYEKSSLLGVTIEDHDWEHYTLYRPVMRTRELSREKIAQWFAKILLETSSFVSAEQMASPDAV